MFPLLWLTCFLLGASANLVEVNGLLQTRSTVGALAEVEDKSSQDIVTEVSVDKVALEKTLTSACEAVVTRGLDWDRWWEGSGNEGRVRRDIAIMSDHLCPEALADNLQVDIDQAQAACKAAKDAATSDSVNDPEVSFCQALWNSLESKHENLVQISRGLIVLKDKQNPNQPSHGKIGDGSSCFTGDGLVRVLVDGQVLPKKIRELRPADLVQAVDPSTQKPFFTKMLMDLHSSEEHSQEHTFLELQHQFGSVRLTPGHFIYAPGKGFLPAEDLVVGDALLYTSDLGAQEIVSVTAIVSITDTGFFAPLTWEGYLVVDGVLASSYARPPESLANPTRMNALVSKLGGWDNLHQIEHLLMFPLRAWHSMVLSSSAGWLMPQKPGGFWSPSASNEDWNDKAWHVPRYVDILYKASSSAISLLV